MLGSNVEIVTAESTGRPVEYCDGLITNEKDLYLSVTVADCLALFFFDPKNQVIALVHAGWPGLSLGIIPVTISRMEKYFLCNPKDILVATSPCISQKNYEVKEDVLKKFSGFQDAIKEEEGKYFLDIREIARRQILACGADEKNIEVNNECTYENKEKFFSFRRDKPKIAHPHMVLFKML